MRGKEEKWGEESGREERRAEKEPARQRKRESSELGIGGSRRPGDGGGGRERSKRGRELDVRTNAICMILHVLARPGAAPIGFQLSVYVFCLLFWLRHGRHAGRYRIERREREGQRARDKTERERKVESGWSREVAASSSTRKEIIFLGFSPRGDARSPRAEERRVVEERGGAVGLLTSWCSESVLLPCKIRCNKIFSWLNKNSKRARARKRAVYVCTFVSLNI